MLVLTLKAPRNAAQARDSLALVEAACNIADAIELGTAKLREITVTKLRRTRADVDKQLQEEATKEQREEVSQSSGPDRAPRVRLVATPHCLLTHAVGGGGAPQRQGQGGQGQDGRPLGEGAGAAEGDRAQAADEEAGQVHQGSLSPALVLLANVRVVTLLCAA